MTVVLSLEQVGPWIDGLGRQMPIAAKRGLYSAALRIAQHVASSGDWPVDRGTSRSGWRAEPREYGADVFNLTPHALFIEEGVRGENVKIGRAMIEALSAWVKRKGIGVTYGQGAGGKQKAVKPNEDERSGIAWAIAKSMQKKGIFSGGKHLLRHAMATVGPQYVREEVSRELKREFGL